MCSYLIVVLNMMHIGSTTKSRSVIQVPQVAPNIWIINNPLPITLEKELNKYYIK